MDWRLSDVDCVAVRIDRSSSERNSDAAVLQIGKVIGEDRRSRAVVEDIDIHIHSFICPNFCCKGIADIRPGLPGQTVDDSGLIAIGSQLGPIGGPFVDAPLISTLNENANGTLKTIRLLTGINRYRSNLKVLE